MAQNSNKDDARAALVRIAQDFHRRGWMPGTAGNLSVRDGAEDFWITASGKPKGRLESTDFLLVRVADGAIGETLAPRHKPSAETAIHRAIYTLFADAGACLHVHSVDACIAADTVAAGETALPLPPLEMLKGFDIWQQQPRIALPLFDNFLQVEDIAAAIVQRFSAHPPALSALMIRGHGATVWGKNLQQAYDRVECLEFLLSYVARTRRC